MELDAADPAQPESMDKNVIAFRKSQPQVTAVENASVPVGARQEQEEGEYTYESQGKSLRRCGKYQDKPLRAN